MKNRTLVNIILIIAGIAAGAIIVGDFIINRRGQNITNPYQLNLSEFRIVDSLEIKYNENITIQLAPDSWRSMAYDGEEVYLLSNNKLTIMDLSGVIRAEVILEATPTAIAVSNDVVWLAFKNYVAYYDKNGEEIDRWADFDSRTVITSLAVTDNRIFVADGGNRIVYACDHNGRLITRIGDKNSDTPFSGFIVPSPYFDLDIASDGSLWVVNPGKHALVNFTSDGEYVTSWTQSSARLEGFSGCCNPTAMALLSNDKFVTAEKKLFRVKVYDSEGNYECVVAPPASFDKSGLPLDVCVDENDRVMILDVNRNQIRIFVTV